MTATTRTLSAAALALALGSALSIAALPTTAHAAATDMEKMLWRRHERQERLRRRCRHYLRGHLENRLREQPLQTGAKRHLREDRQPDLTDRLRSNGRLQSQVVI